MSQNGKLPTSELADVPGGRLAREAAANWLALRSQGGRELGVWISPLGPRSSYRSFEEQQYFWNLYKSGKGNLAAKPGTSNHGWGHAVDLASPGPMRKVIDRFGKDFGWQWGEVSSEPWHVTYRGGGKADAEALKQTDGDHPTLRCGSRGDHVKDVQRWLRGRGFNLEPDGIFGPVVEDAVNRLYRAWGHAARGHFGDVGWSVVEDRHPWRVLMVDERGNLADLFFERRIAHRAGGWEKVDKSHLEAATEYKARLVARRQELWRLGKSEDWKKNSRAKRYRILRAATI